MQEPCAQIIQSIQAHGPSKGCPNVIQADGPQVAWSWKAFVNAMQPEEANKVVGPGLVGISLYPRLGTLDHHRAQFAKNCGESLNACEGRPPIWDFQFFRSDGTFVLVHPRPYVNCQSLEFAALMEECQQASTLLPSVPLHQVCTTVEPQSATGGHVTFAPPGLSSPPGVVSAAPARPQSDVMTAQAMAPVAKAAVPASVQSPAQQADHAKAAPPCSKIEAIARLRAVRPFVRPDQIWWQGRWWKPQWWNDSSQGSWSSEWRSSQDGQWQ
jgi:hypothetical protein